MEIAGQRKGLLIVAGTLSALSSACMLVPYWAVYEVLRLLLTGNAASGEMVHWGWVAFGGLVAGLVLLYLALMASHVAAFNVLYGLRIRITEHIGRLSLGYLNGTTTGAIKKTMEQNVEKIETFIAHTIPDLVGIVATVAVTLAIFLSLNAWLALAVLLVVLALWLQFSVFMGEKTKEFVRLYYDAQEQMSGSAVQYVRGMHVVKIFGQSVASFRQFGREIEAYKTYALGVCDTYERGYCRPECNRCSQVCPAGAIKPITLEEKSSTQIGHAVWIKKNCIPVTDGVECGNCERHCPTGAIEVRQ